MPKYKKRIKKKRKKRIFPYILFSLFSIIILSSLIYLFLFSSVFSLRDINVNLEDEEINSLVSSYRRKNILSTESIFLFKSKELSEKIPLLFPHIKEAKFKLDLFSLSYNLKLTKREKVIVVCNNEDCFKLDIEGIPFSPSKKITPYISTEKEIILGKEIFSEVIFFISQIKDSFNSEIIFVESERRINIKTKENYYLYLNPKEDPLYQIEDFNVLFEEKIIEDKGSLEYIDLRFKDRVYYMESGI